MITRPTVIPQVVNHWNDETLERIRYLLRAGPTKLKGPDYRLTVGTVDLHPNFRIVYRIAVSSRKCCASKCV